MRHWDNRLGVLHGLADDGLAGQVNEETSRCGPVYTKPEGYTETETDWGTVYTKLYSDVYTFEAGQALCASDKTDDTVPHMAIPKDLNQNAFFFDIAAQAGKDNDADLWLGISRYGPDGLDVSGNWYDTDGELQTFFKWQMANRKLNGHNYLEMILSGTEKQNSKWIDWKNKDGSGPDSRVISKKKDNMVLCTFTVPNTEPETDCGYGWEVIDLSDGRKCAQHNYYNYLHEEAVTHCEAQDARLAQPKNGSDNQILSEAYGFRQKNPDNQTLSIWLAATKADGTWKDIHDGSPITYFNWRHKKPNGEGNFIKLVLNEGTTYKKPNGVMSDKPSTAQSMFGFICVR